MLMISSAYANEPSSNCSLNHSRVSSESLQLFSVCCFRIWFYELNWTRMILKFSNQLREWLVNESLSGFYVFKVRTWWIHLGESKGFILQRWLILMETILLNLVVNESVECTVCIIALYFHRPITHDFGVCSVNMDQIFQRVPWYWMLNTLLLNYWWNRMNLTQSVIWVLCYSYGNCVAWCCGWGNLSDRRTIIYFTLLVMSVDWFEMFAVCLWCFLKGLEFVTHHWLSHTSKCYYIYSCTGCNEWLQWGGECYRACFWGMGQCCGVIY